TIVFNSCGQWQRFQPLIQAAKAQRPELKFGLRINSEHSEGTVPIYDPCAPGSRLGIPLSALDESMLEGMSGLHCHTLCEQADGRKACVTACQVCAVTRCAGKSLRPLRAP